MTRCILGIMWSLGAHFLGERQSAYTATSESQRRNGGETMKLRKDSADKGAGSGWMARLVVLLLFISVGQAFASGCQTDRSQMVALEVLPPWVFGLIVVGCPLVVLARLVWGPSPWGIQQHKEEEQTREQNDQGK